MKSSTIKILLINPPHTAIGSRIQKKSLAPLSLISLGKSLIDAGFEVAMIDAEHGHRTLFDIVRACRKQAPQYVMLEYTSSASVHATVMMLCAMLKFSMPNLVIFYGGMSSPHHHVEFPKPLNF